MRERRFFSDALVLDGMFAMVRRCCVREKDEEKRRTPRLGRVVPIGMAVVAAKFDLIHRLHVDIDTHVNDAICASLHRIARRTLTPA